MAEQLTQQQKDAVYNRGGKLLVSAAAGSGKTKVLVDRLLSYITDPADPADVDDFLIITYTKAAAAELRGKIAAKLTERIAEDPANRHLQRQMQRLYLAKISTVHSFCSDILKEFSYMLDISADFRMADESEEIELKCMAAEHVLEEAYNQKDPDFYAFIDTQGLGRSDYLIPEILFDVYEKSRCHLDPDQWLDDCLRASDVTEIGGVEDTVWGTYLIEDLHRYLDMHIQALTNCATLADAEEHMEKPAALLWAIVDDLRRLRNSHTWDAIIENRNIDYGRLTFGKKCENTKLINQIKAARDACKKGMAKRLDSVANPSEQVLKDMEVTAAAMRGLVGIVKAFAKTYDSMKRSRRILDFSDLEQKALDLLVGKSRQQPTILAAEIGARFREVMVDEYQDSNAVQDRIFSALTEKRQNCFMVGDVKQSIYQFRLADPEIFLQKYKGYAPVEEAQPGMGRKVLLSKNFRSSQGVITAVNDVFSTCMSEQVGGLEYGPDESLHEGIPHVPLNEPEIALYGIEVEHDTYQEEAAFVANRVVELLDGKHHVREKDVLRPVKADDIVILLRSPGSVGSVYQSALEASGVRCTTGSSRDLMQAEEIVVFRSVLQTIHNPLQDIPLVSTLTSRVFGFTADDLAYLRSNTRYGSIYKALQHDKREKSINFLEQLTKLRTEARNASLTQLLNKVLLETKLDSIYGAMNDGHGKAENIHTFCQLAAAFESNAQGNLGRFLDYLTTLEQTGYVAGDDSVSGAVRIMSIHKSKGLEFPVVFLCGLSKAFNKDDARAPVLCDRELGLGLCCADMKNRIKYPTVAKRAISEKKIRDAVSEELRVLYVAMTRAKDRLIMTYAQKGLEGKLADLAYRMEVSPSLLLTSDVDCAGEWVLQAALKMQEAGCLLPDDLSITGAITHVQPWLIRCVCAPEESKECVEKTIEREESIPAETFSRMQKHLSYQYPHIAATLTPSKQTATQLKGRNKDAEVAEGTASHYNYAFRKPVFVSSEQDGTVYGKLMHLVMQYIRYDRCGEIGAIRNELERLVSDGYLTRAEAERINVDQIHSFFASDIGRKLICSDNVLREFKFSILDDGNTYAEGLENESILLQGIVDCALLEKDGITVIDFKTDYVTEDTLNSTFEKYKTQVKTYMRALERIYGLPVKSAFVYFFRLNRFCQI